MPEGVRMKIKLDTTSNLVSIIGPLVGAAWWVWEWINPPKRWPGLRVLEFIGPIVGLLAILLVGFAIAAGLYRLTRLERGFNQDQARRDKEFTTWLEQRGAKVEADFRRDFDQGLYQAKETERRALEAVDRFHRTYDERLSDVELLSEEGPWVPMQVGQRTYKLTEAAHKEFVSRDAATQQEIVRHFAYWERSRLHRKHIQSAAGDFFQTREGAREWSYHELFEKTDDERAEIFKREPALWRWYDEQAKRRGSS
jgi:hypothetical protein